MPESVGTFRTAHASKYLKQLCKHFSHKIRVEYDDLRGICEMPMGRAVMTAQPARLEVMLDGADDAAIGKMQGVIDRHLAIFAHRETFDGLDWEPASERA